METFHNIMSARSTRFRLAACCFAAAFHFLISPTFADSGAVKLGNGMALSIPSLKTEEARPAVPYVDIHQYIDQSMRELAAASPEQLPRLVLRFESALKARPAEEYWMLSRYGYTVIPKSNGVEYLVPNRDRNAVLRKAIPALIAQLDGSQAVAQSAYWILINLQGHCPEPKREVWELWWRNTGSKLYDDLSK